MNAIKRKTSSIMIENAFKIGNMKKLLYVDYLFKLCDWQCTVNLMFICHFCVHFYIIVDVHGHDIRVTKIRMHTMEILEMARDTYLVKYNN